MNDSLFYRFYLVDRNSESPLEYCYYIQTATPFTEQEVDKLSKLLKNSFAPQDKIRTSPSLISKDEVIVERGPKLRFQSEWGTNAKTILHKCGLTQIVRIEKFVRGYEDELIKSYDKMVEDIYYSPITSFESYNNQSIKVKNPTHFNKIKCDLDALKTYNEREMLGFTDEVLEYYYDMWVKQKRKHITDIELFDLAQSNSEHSRHHIFRGELTYPDGTAYCLMDLVKAPLQHLDKSTDNSVVAFSDNSSAIKHYTQRHLIRENPSEGGSKYTLRDVDVNTLLTAETHNFPTGIAPFPGAATGTGGRIRDSQCIGRGGMFIAGMCGYCVGSMGMESLKDIETPLERKEYLWSGAEILVKASNGASDYGNKIGEPVIQGFTRSFGSTIDGKRKEWIKPIMFTSGVGMVYSEHLKKKEPELGMFIIRVGGPAYRIGVGGGTASSMSQTSSMISKLEASVQRGDPEMEQKLDRFIRACVEMGDKNPILSIHDQGAGGMANVTKEIVGGLLQETGALIDIRSVYSGDDSLTIKELWTAEYQEQNTFLANIRDIGLLKRIAQRENVPLRVVGVVTNDGRFTVHDRYQSHDAMIPVDFDLHSISDLPHTVYNIPFINDKSESYDTNVACIRTLDNISIVQLLKHVLLHPSVCSKRFLTNKVDRSVGGLIAQQQCVGPLHTPLADVAVVSHSFFGLEGAATAIGERPIIGISNCGAMARMAVGEMLTNMVWAKVDGLNKIKCSGNWMWPAKEAVEKSRMLSACKALSELLIQLELSIDGGKDSLSMSSTMQSSGKVVDAPPQLVMTGYVSMKNITKKVTPDLKSSGNSLLYLNLFGKHRIGSSILTQISFSKDSCLAGFVPNDYPDVDDAMMLKRFFNTIQKLVDEDLIVSGHDVSDGGMITTVLEMAFAGNKGLCLDIDLSDAQYTDKRFKIQNMLSFLFSEELGAVIEVPTRLLELVEKRLNAEHLNYQYIGFVSNENIVKVTIDDEIVIKDTVSKLRDVWEQTSFELEKMQCLKKCVNSERKYLIDAGKLVENNNR